MIKKLLLLFTVLSTASAVAQTFEQRGVVRMITTSASSPVTPVAGVKVAVGNSLSKATDAKGRFSMQVTQEFQVNGVLPSEEYILALPTKGKTYFQSKNDLDVVVTTKARQEEDYKKLYARLKAKYDEQSDEIVALKRTLQRRMNDLDEADEEFVTLSVKLDSIQQLYLQYINNESQINDEIKKTAEEISLTDYHSLDELNRKIYELKKAGEWKSISDLINDVMKGDAAAYLKEAADNRAKAEALKMAADRDFEARVELLVEAIQAYKIQYKNSEVSEYYKILTDFAPRWEFLHDAGKHERMRKANYELALKYLERSLEVAEDDLSRAQSYRLMGLVYSDLADYDKAMEFNKKFMDAAKDNEEYKDQQLPIAYMNLARIYFLKKDFENAIELGHKSIELYEKQTDKDLNKYGLALQNLGLYYGESRENDKALEYLFKAVEILKPLEEDYDEPALAYPYLNIGRCYGRMDDHENALKYYQMALDIWLSKLGETHPNTAIAFNNLGNEYLEVGDYEKAKEYIGKALVAFRAIYGDNHRNVAIAYNNLGQCETLVGNYAKSVEFTEKAIEVLLKSMPEDHPEIKTLRQEVEELKQRMEKQ